jgi:hypothetical protein
MEKARAVNMPADNIKRTIDKATGGGDDPESSPQALIHASKYLFRPDASKVAVAYEDTSNGSYKYAIQYKTGWNIQTIDHQTTIAGGYMSMQFQPYKSADGTYHPTASYYDAGNSALKFAAFDARRML